MGLKTVAIVGLGARGLQTYAGYQKLFPDRMKIVAIADPVDERVELAAKEYGVSKENCFHTAEELFQQKRLADAVFIATQDRQHVAHAIMALDLGYDILLEKPISNDLNECLALKQKVQETQKLVLICHVLRYTEFFRTIKNLIDDGKIGEVVSVQAIENVSYWHQAHSFVRGNWQNSEETSPMILQKCCHDFDIYSWLIGKKCIAVSSFGSLKFFKEKNAPQGSAEYCYDCKYLDECAYSAKKIYFEQPDIGLLHGNTGWPNNVIAENPTEKTLYDNLHHGRYGKCVFRCNNNVVDHQVINLLMEDEVTVNFTMCAFTAENSRYVKIMGTQGEIVADQNLNTVILKPFGKPSTVYDINLLAEDLSGHGGGDNKMLTEFFAYLNGDMPNISSTIENSIQSHEIAFASEYSRLHNGELVNLKEFITNQNNNREE